MLLLSRNPQARYRYRNSQFNPMEIFTLLFMLMLSNVDRMLTNSFVVSAPALWCWSSLYDYQAGFSTALHMES
jgi:hypothetical protein